MLLQTNKIMHNKPLISLLYLNLTLLLSLFFITAFGANELSCPNCGKMKVPFPLSTSPTCGDPSYKVRCIGSKLWFNGLHNTSYKVSSISPQIQQLIIRPADYAPNSCTTSDFKAGGLWLDDNLPFNISTDNTILKFNCTTLIYVSAMNCSSTSICYRYMKENQETAEKCGGAHLLCCSYTGGGSQNDDNIKLRAEKCAAYRSFVGISLETSLPVSKWPEPGVAVQWASPPEPLCSKATDCKKLPKSSCLPDVGSGQKRCLCKKGFQWDPTHGKCSKVICETARCRRQRKRKRIITGLTYAGGTILVLVSFAFLVYDQHQRIKREARRKLVRERQQILNANNTSGRSAKLFSAKEIKKATFNFSNENLLGTGGFGEVYKGKLDDGTIVAVKRAKLGNTKGTDQVLNEVRVLCQVNHRRLVRLLGCCVELDDPVLVYEYIPNGTLHDYLHKSHSEDNTKQRLVLTWQHRLLIAQQTAQGLAYLHFSAVPPIFHRDIKTSNILLDERLDAKVSDFGVSRLVDDTEATHMTTCAQGTLGYLDPQYYRNMQLTDKSDVYSFGVVLLELLTTKKAIDFNREVEDVSLVAYMRKMVNVEKTIEAVDPLLQVGASKLELETMKSLGILAMACVDEQRQNRPSMREVVEEIEYLLHILNKDPKFELKGNTIPLNSK